MKKPLLLIFIFNFLSLLTFGQCTINFSSLINADTVNFTSTSIPTNLGTYWNFGDGTSSIDRNPVHIYPLSGEYIVTLYGLDTTNNCSNFSQSIINVLKPDTFACKVKFTTTINNDTTDVINLSTNCNGAYFACPINATGQNYCGGSILSDWGSAQLLQNMFRINNDPVHPYRLEGGYMRTLQNNFSPAINYQGCSSNFEFLTTLETDSARVTFKAMSDDVSYYQFRFIGFGNPINVNSKSTTFSFPYTSYQEYSPYVVYLTTTNSITNCSSISTQLILIKNRNYQEPIRCDIIQQPVNQIVNNSQTAQFSINIASNADLRWEENSGLGFVPLVESGKYVGVRSKTLTINQVDISLNNNKYRCIVSSNNANPCRNISNEALLSLISSLNNIKNSKFSVFPNPASNSINIDLDNQFENPQVKIYNSIGVLCHTEILNNKLSSLSIDHMSKGIYLVQIQDNKSLGHQLFVRE